MCVVQWSDVAISNREYSHQRTHRALMFSSSSLRMTWIIIPSSRSRGIAREREREIEREIGREGMEGAREGGREGGRGREREVAREGGSEGGREGGRERERGKWR